MDEQVKETRRQYIHRLINRRRAFKAVFQNERGELTADGKIALRELADFCHVKRPSYKVSPRSGTIDPLAMAVAEGRREVFLRIARLLGDDTDFYQALNQLNED